MYCRSVPVVACAYCEKLLREPVLLLSSRVLVGDVEVDHRRRRGDTLIGGLVNGLTCIEIVEVGSGAKFSIEDLKSLSSLSPTSIQSCLANLGKDLLEPEQSNTLWKVIVKVYGSAAEIPENDLRLLGWIISGIPANDFYNLSMSDVDTIAAFGQYRNLSPAQLSALREVVSSIWSDKMEEDLSSYDLITLKQIICAFNSSNIKNIHSDAYRDAAPVLATLQDCPQDVLIELAKLAVNEDAFGNPQEWTSNKVMAVGCVISGLPNVKIIPAEAMSGLTRELIKCLPVTTLQALSEDQVSQIPVDISGRKAEAPLSVQKPTQHYNSNFQNSNYSDGRNGSSDSNASRLYTNFRTDMIFNVNLIILLLVI